LRRYDGTAGRALVRRIKPPGGVSSLRASITHAYALRLRAEVHRCALAWSAVFPEFITFFATVAHLRLRSRRTKPCPRCAAGRTILCFFPWPKPQIGDCRCGRWTQERRRQHSQSGGFLPPAQNSRKAGSESRNPVAANQGAAGMRRKRWTNV